MRALNKSVFTLLRYFWGQARSWLLELLLKLVQALLHGLLVFKLKFISCIHGDFTVALDQCGHRLVKQPQEIAHLQRYILHWEAVIEPEGEHLEGVQYLPCFLLPLTINFIFQIFAIVNSIDFYFVVNDFWSAFWRHLVAWLLIDVSDQGLHLAEVAQLIALDDHSPVSAVNPRLFKCPQMGRWWRPRHSFQTVSIIFYRLNYFHLINYL